MFSDTEQITRKHIIQNFNKAAATFDAAAFLFSKTHAEMIERLDVIAIHPKRILDCGAGTGMGASLLKNKFPQAEIHCMDLSSVMLKEAVKKKLGKKISYSCSDASSLPFQNQTFDFIYANLMLYLCSDIHKVFSEWQRVLKPNGLLMFSTFGPDTFKELFSVTEKINPSEAKHQFIEMHNLGDALIKNHLLDPVIEAENIQVKYSKGAQLLKEFRDVGGRNLYPLRKRQLSTKHYRTMLLNELAALQGEDNKISLSVEIIYAHAWANPSQPLLKQSKEVAVPLLSIKRLILPVKNKLNKLR